MISSNFIILGVIIQFIGGVSYIIDTLKGRVQPNRVSWGLWAIAALTAFAAEVKQGVGIQSLATFIVGFNPLLIFIASFVNKKAFWKIGKLDILCGVFSLIGISLWIITKVGNLAILFSIFADLLACIPTLVKAYKDPESESHMPFSLGLVSPIMVFLSTDNWNFETYAFPIYLFIANFVIFVLIKFKLGKLITRFQNS